MSKKTLFVIVGAAALILAAGWAVAKGPMSFHGRHQMKDKFITWYVTQTLQDIKATDEQKTRIMAVKDRMFQEGAKLREKHEAVHETLQGQWAAGKVDAAALHSLVDQRVEELRGVLHKGVDAFVEVHDTLTPEQRQQVIQAFEELHGMH